MNKRRHAVWKGVYLLPKLACYEALSNFNFLYPARLAWIIHKGQNADRAGKIWGCRPCFTSWFKPAMQHDRPYPFFLALADLNQKMASDFQVLADVFCNLPIGAEPVRPSP